MSEWRGEKVRNTGLRNPLRSKRTSSSPGCSETTEHPSHREYAFKQILKEFTYDLSNLSIFFHIYIENEQTG